MAALVGLIVAALAVTIWVCVGQNEKLPDSDETPLVRDQQKVGKMKGSKKANRTKKTEKQTKKNTPRTARPGEERIRRDGQKEKELTATNEMPEKVEEPARKEPLFKHGTEQLLALATPSELGTPVPPLPKITDESVAEDLAKAMKSAIGPSTNDTERTLEIKLNVAQQKEEFRELRKEGMTFSEYVNALREKFNEDAAFLSEARKLDEKLFNDKLISDKEYKAYRKEINENLKQRGLPELEER